MIDWDQKLLAKLKSYKMVAEIYKRIKDYFELAIDGLKRGSKLVQDKSLLMKPKSLAMKSKVTIK